MKKILFRFTIFTLMLAVGLIVSCNQQQEKLADKPQVKDDLQLDKIPLVIMNALKNKFPKAEIHKWTQEQEGDIVVYDIEFKQDGQKFEADIKEDGNIHNWEKEIMAEDLPEVVKKAAETKYSNSSIKEIMEITAVMDGKDTLEGYEINLETADQQEVEITVAPDGVILEDSGEKQAEKE
ncbi:PepSY-like domain-containing protein [Calditrichota bacterium]